MRLWVKNPEFGVLLQFLWWALGLGFIFLWLLAEQLFLATSIVFFNSVGRVMVTEFVSTDQDFSSRVNKLYLTMALLQPVLAFWLVVLVYSIVYHEGRGRRTKLERILEGLSYMSATSVVVSIGVILVLVAAGLIWRSAYYGKREIVVGLKFDDALKKLTVKTKTTSGWEFEKVHQYKDLSFYKDNLSDGMTTSYNALTLAKGDEVVGHILMNHFTWDIKTTMEIEAKLRSAK